MDVLHHNMDPGNLVPNTCGSQLFIYNEKFSLVSKTLLKNSASLVYVVISPQMVFVAGQILTSLLAMLTLNWRRVSMEVPHVTGYRVPVDELVADCALDFIAI